MTLALYSPKPRLMKAKELEAAADYLFMRLALIQTAADTEYRIGKRDSAMLKFELAEALAQELKAATSAAREARRTGGRKRKA